MNLRMSIIAAVFAVLPQIASAQDFLDGWYWNPDESGWGMNVEVQGSTMFLAIFTYRQNGSPIWYFGTGEIDYETRTVDTEMSLATDGACFACPYQTPSFDIGGGGDISLSFNNRFDIEVTWKGRTTNVQRQYWSFGPLEDFLFGLWAVVRGIESPFADYYYLNSRERDPSGDMYVAGESTSGSIVVADWYPNSQQYAMLDGKSTGDWYYEFEATKELMLGKYWILDPGENPTGPGTDFVSYRFGQQDIPRNKSHSRLLQELERAQTKETGKSIDPKRTSRYLMLKARLEHVQLGAEPSAE